MDSSFYIDTRTPDLGASYPAVTLTTTLKAIVPAGAYPRLGPSYFNYVGKAIRLTAWGLATHGATPGNVTYQPIWGDGTDNQGLTFTGAIVSGFTSATVTFKWEMIYRCRAIGALGQLQAQGLIMMQTQGYTFIPPSGVLSVSNLDLTQDYIPNFQISRSGSTAESYQVTDMLFEALN